MADTPETNEAPAAEVDDAKPAKRALIEAAVARIERKLSGFYALRSRRVRPKAKEPSQRDLHRAEARKRDLAERQEARKRLVERLTKELAERDAALDRKRAARARQRRAERD